MPDAPTLPGTKKPANKKKVMIIGGVAVIGGAIGIIYLRSHGSSSSAASSQSGIDPNTGVPYSEEAVDPATGVPYADEGSYGGAVGTAAGELGTYNPLTGQYTPGLGTTTNPIAPASNANWAQAAIAQLEANGFDPVSAATSIGLYLSGQPLTSDQYSAVQAALGLEGNPPQGAPVATQISGGGGTGSGTGTVSGTNPVVTIPNVIGMTFQQAQQTLEEAGLYSYAHNVIPKGTGYVTGIGTPTGPTTIGSKVPLNSGISLALSTKKPATT